METTLADKIAQVRSLLEEMSKVKDRLEEVTEDMGPEAEGAMEMITDGVNEMERAMSFLDQ